MPLTHRRRRPLLTLAFFLIIVVGGGWLIGSTNLPGTWYAALIKPSFNPPNWVFPIVWTLIYIMVALAGRRTFEPNSLRSAKILWLLQLALNFAWSPIMFTLHSIGAALLVISLLLLAIVAFVATQWRHDPWAALLFLPYAAWVGFASLLNFSLYRLNG